MAWMLGFEKKNLFFKIIFQLLHGSSVPVRVQAVF